MIEQSRYFGAVMKKHFHKELVMIKKDMILRTLLIVGSLIMIILTVMLKSEIIVISLENTEAIDIEIVININVKINHKIPIVFHNLKNYDSHLIMQELCKFNLKINVIPNGLEKYMAFGINNELSFIDGFQFLSSSLDS